GRYQVTSKRVAMRHRLSIGAIVSDAMMQVKLLGGKHLGTIEEWFISRLQPGDTFWFSGRLLELVRVKDIQAVVRPAAGRKGAGPSTIVGRCPSADNFGRALLHTFAELDERKPPAYPAELLFLQPLFDEQQRIAEMPAEDELLVEYIRTQYGHHLFVFPF